MAANTPDRQTPFDPKDPAAYPHYPPRPKGLARTFHVVVEDQDDSAELQEGSPKQNGDRR